MPSQIGSKIMEGELYDNLKAENEVRVLRFLAKLCLKHYYAE